MAGRVRHLLERAGRYHARIVVPERLRPILKKVELSAALGADRREALRKLPAVPASVGSGIVDKYKPIAEYSLRSLLAASTAEGQTTTVDDEPDETQPTTVAEVMAEARERVATLLGVRSDAVKLDLKVEY